MTTVEVKKSVENVQQIDPKEIKKVRHKAEIPFSVVSVLILILAVAALILSATPPVKEILRESYPGQENLSEYLSFIFIIPISIIILLYKTYATTRAYAIRVTEKNFPEIYYKSVEFAKKLGMKKVPAVYIEQKNGALNAFAATVIGKRYAGLNAEIVDIAYMEHKDFNPVYFVMAHEFGHLYLKHPTVLYNILFCVGRMIPVFGATFSRAREYSCDRIAQLLLEGDCVNEAMILNAGRHLYKYVDAKDYLDGAKKEKGFFLWVVNLTASHPVSLKRITALADPHKKSGKLF